MTDKKDKEDGKPNAQIYTLNRSSQTTKEPEQSVTQHGDEVTTSTQQKWSPFRNPDGTPNQAAEEYFRTRVQQPLQKEYGINPETGQVDDPTIYSVLGIRPEENRARREQEAKQNRRKQIASALYHSGALISDMLSSAYGGNVWKRDKDTTAKEAAARNLQLQAEQQAEDAAVAQARNKRQQAYWDAVRKAREVFDKNYTLTQTVTTKQRGDSTTTKTGGNSRTTGWDQSVVKDGNGKNSGSGSSIKNPWYMNVIHNNLDKGGGKVRQYELPEQKFKAIAGLLKTYYNNLVNQKDKDGNLTPFAEDLRKQLLNAQILKKTEGTSILTKKDIEQNDFDENQIMWNGQFWNLNDAMMDEIEELSGGKVKFTRKDDDGWGDVGNNDEEYDD